MVQGLGRDGTQGLGGGIGQAKSRGGLHAFGLAIVAAQIVWIPFWAAGISLYATNSSSIGYIATTAKAFATNWQYLVGNLLGALTAEVPQATTLGLGDQVDSQASLANLALSIAGSNIGADFLIAQATANNQNLAVAAARVRQARAIAGIAESDMRKQVEAFSRSTVGTEEAPIPGIPNPDTLRR